MAYKSEQKSNNNFKSITISLASPESILERSCGEVLKPETINYRTYKPEADGLFCEKIFGPVKDWECHCGKYKRIRYKGIICDRCGVKVTEKKVRRENSGHIKLVVPVAHIWYFRSLPNKIGALLGLQTKKLDSIIYYEKFIVINPGIVAQNPEINGSHYMDLLTEEEYYNIVKDLPAENQYLDDSDPDKFVAKMGAEAICELLSKIDLDADAAALRKIADEETSQQRKAEALKRLHVFEAFREANKKMENRPEWMIIKVVPVIPPELRPLVPLDGGRFATSDLNDLYRRVIIRNNRLKRLIEIKAPDVIMRNEKRMLQEAVDALLNNSRKTNSVRPEANNALKSLSDSLKGKQGRFRQNLLGKRVDYSGRSVIVVGPELKLNECGLPKEMASELYKPFIIRKLIERGIVKTVKSAKKIVDKKDTVVWDILENILKGHPILLNRAPTLHRLGIQAFQPKLIEGKAIQLHPLACTAFNADFDGDQMAVHVPLGNAAVLEAQMLMLASHNILNPANGAPTTVPSQDMILGLYYMTKERKSTPEYPIKGEGLRFYSPEEVIIAYNEHKVDMHAGITVRILNVETNKYENIHTTTGRVLFNRVTPPTYPFINQLLKKKNVRDIISDVLKKTDNTSTIKFLDAMKEMGYRNAFEAGLSFNLGDILIPENKAALIEDAHGKVDEITDEYNFGNITNTERYNQVIDTWGRVVTQITDSLTFEHFPIADGNFVMLFGCHIERDSCFTIRNIDIDFDMQFHFLLTDSVESRRILRIIKGISVTAQFQAIISKRIIFTNGILNTAPFQPRGSILKRNFPERLLNDCFRNAVSLHLKAVCAVNSGGKPAIFIECHRRKVDFSSGDMMHDPFINLTEAEMHHPPITSRILHQIRMTTPLQQIAPEIAVCQNRIM
mgnify:CR=1 FL=1